MRWQMQRSILASAVVLGAAAASAGESPLDMRDAWRFDGGDWQFVEKRLTQRDPEPIVHAHFPAQAYGDCTVGVRFRAHDDGKGVKAAGLILRSQDSLSGYTIHYDTKNNQVILSRLQFGVGRIELGRRRHVEMDTGTWYTAEAEVTAGTVSARLDGKTLLTAEDPTPLPPGIPGLYTSQGKIDFAEFRVDGTRSELSSPWRRRMSYEAPTDQTIATIDWIKPVCKEPGRYIGWPTICRRADGELLAVFSGDRDAHVCPWGKVQLVRSADDGESWSEPVSICCTPLDDRDAGIIETVEGDLVVNWFTSLAFDRPNAPELWQRHAGKLTPEIRQQWLGYWTRRSTDGGKTWDEPVKHEGNAPHGGIRLRDGRLLFVGKSPMDGRTTLVAEESRDGGRSWQKIGTIAQDPEDDANQYFEPHVVETADGRLVAMFRYHYRDPGTGQRNLEKCFLRQSESSDGGHTWTTCHTTPLQGFPPHLLCLADGTLLCVYGRRCAPYGEVACISRDGGRTWLVEDEVYLARAANGDLGYPASTQLADGSIITVYYQVAAAGEKTCLMATRWRLK